MTILIAVIVVGAVVGAGVGFMLYSDHREHKRMVRNGGHVVLLGIPGTKDMTIEDYGKNVIFKGITLHGVIGRRMFKTWYHMLALLKSGLSVEHVVTQEFPLSDFDKGMAAFNGGESLKVVLFNN